MEDRQGDTLLAAGALKLRITDLLFLNTRTPEITYTGLKDAYVNLSRNRDSGTWNYQFIADAFAPSKSTAPKKGGGWEPDLNLDLIFLERVRVHLTDAWNGSDLKLNIGSLKLDARRLDIPQKKLHIRELALANSSVYTASYAAGRPKTNSRMPRVIDTTAFNPAKWVLALDKLSITGSSFTLDADKKQPRSGEFDPAHIDVRDIIFYADGIKVDGDTLTGRITHLEGNERSGFLIRKFSADVSVSPKASVCRNLYLETNNSVLKDYYSMHYTRFPDFTDYLNRVEMRAAFREAAIDINDIAYFAPDLRRLAPAVWRASGKIRGTVADINGQELLLGDGTSLIRGNLSMTGLPDFNNTYISFSKGSISTSGAGILRYVPSLKNHPDLALEQIRHASLQGEFKGYPDRFSTRLHIATNLGNVHSDIRLILPSGTSGRQQKQSYEGYIATESMNLGALFRKPALGSISMYADLRGTGFSPSSASLNLKARIASLGIRGYDYRNILAEGTLNQNQFDGNFLVDDPNIALGFYGHIDFSQPEQISINARANLLQSDLQALGISGIPTLASADFDLNCTGSNLDDFTGYAKLYNINILRNDQRVDLDSVSVESGRDAFNRKTLLVNSNDLTASIRGNYLLSKMGISVRHYLHGYLPHYIAAPGEEAPEQDLNFDIRTRQIDNLFAALLPGLGGFNHSSLRGSLQTGMQQLLITASIPSGSIGGIAFQQTEFTASGDYETLTLNSTIGQLQVSDTLLSFSVQANATLGNDSLRFRIGSTSPYNYGTATINGEAYAFQDSLFLQLNPSEFFLGQNRWEIPGGNQFVFSNRHFAVSNFLLRSGLQEIRAGTVAGDSATEITLTDVDLSQLGTIAGMGGYEPEGRLYGKITWSGIFSEPQITGDLNAAGVKLGRNAIGNIVLSGRYNISRKFAVLQSGSGIFRGVSSLKASGAFGIDSTSSGRVIGRLTFTDAPLAWLSPFVEEHIHNLGGTLNGAVQLRGAAKAPEVSGKISLQDASLEVAYLGTTYSIPKAAIDIDSREIRLGSIRLLDQYRNEASLTGSIAHDHLKNFRLQLQVESQQFEVINLKESQSINFYGHLIARVNSMTVTGPIDNIRMNINATPADASQLYLPLSSGGDVGSYSYAYFKSYGTEQDPSKTATRNKNRFTISINAIATPDLTISMIMDPATGDAINAYGTGNVSLEISTDRDIVIHGAYQIEKGDYTFSFRQLAFRRKFLINPGSNITFGGTLEKTTLDVNATYRTMARLYDLLSEREKQGQIIPASELSDAKTAQNVDVLLHMKGSLDRPDLSFRLDMPEKRSIGTYAYTRLERINANDQELFNQVASLLLINAFIPEEGLMGSTATTGAINNMSDIISTTASSQLTGIVNRLTGDQSLQIELKYKNYNLHDGGLQSGGVNRNEFRFGVRQNLFNDRIIVEVGSAYDWGRPTASGTNTANFNLAGDFRLQFLLTEDGRLRTSLFRTSNYDVLVDKNISRAGAGVSWRKTFDNLEEFIRSSKYMKEKQARMQKDTTTTGSSNDGFRPGI